MNSCYLASDPELFIFITQRKATFFGLVEKKVRLYYRKLQPIANIPHVP